MEEDKHTKNYSIAVKLDTENNDVSASNNVNSHRNDDSAINSTKRKKKPKNKSEVSIKSRPKLISK
jgi:hypothetical protein